MARWVQGLGFRVCTSRRGGQSDGHDMHHLRAPGFGPRDQVVCGLPPPPKWWSAPQVSGGVPPGGQGLRDGGGASAQQRVLRHPHRECGRALPGVGEPGYQHNCREDCQSIPGCASSSLTVPPPLPYNPCFRAERISSRCTCRCGARIFRYQSTSTQRLTLHIHPPSASASMSISQVPRVRALLPLPFCPAFHNKPSGALVATCCKMTC